MLPNEIETEDITMGMVSYYVIKDIESWTRQCEDKSILERYDNLFEALGKFKEYKKSIKEYPDDTARTTLGININGIEFDVIHVREGENYLVSDFMKMPGVTECEKFIEDLNVINQEIGFDKIRLSREMTLSEEKKYVRNNVEKANCRNQEIVNNIMDNFESFYASGKLNQYKPRMNQRIVTENKLISEWDNPYLKFTPIKLQRKRSVR